MTAKRDGGGRLLWEQRDIRRIRLFYKKQLAAHGARLENELCNEEKAELFKWICLSRCTVTQPAWTQAIKPLLTTLKWRPYNDYDGIDLFSLMRHANPNSWFTLYNNRSGTQTLSSLLFEKKESNTFRKRSLKKQALEIITLKDDNLKNASQILNAFEKLDKNRLLHKIIIDTIQNNAEHAENIAKALVELQNNQLIKPEHYAEIIARALIHLAKNNLLSDEYRQVIVTYASHAYSVAAALVELQNHQLIKPENINTILKNPKHAETIAQALIHLAKNNLLSDEYRQMMIDRGSYANSLATALVKLNNNKLLTPDNCQAVLLKSKRTADWFYSSHWKDYTGDEAKWTAEALIQLETHQLLSKKNRDYILYGPTYDVRRAANIIIAIKIAIKRKNLADYPKIIELILQNSNQAEQIISAFDLLNRHHVLAQNYQFLEQNIAHIKYVNSVFSFIQNGNILTTQNLIAISRNASILEKISFIFPYATVKNDKGLEQISQENFNVIFDHLSIWKNENLKQAFDAIPPHLRTSLFFTECMELISARSNDEPGIVRNAIVRHIQQVCQWDASQRMLTQMLDRMTEDIRRILQPALIVPRPNIPTAATVQIHRWNTVDNDSVNKSAAESAQRLQNRYSDILRDHARRKELKNRILAFRQSLNKQNAVESNAAAMLGNIVDEQQPGFIGNFRISELNELTAFEVLLLVQRGADDSQAHSVDALADAKNDIIREKEPNFQQMSPLEQVTVATRILQQPHIQKDIAEKSCQKARRSLVQHLHDIYRNYNLNDKGVDLGGPAWGSCTHGVGIKLIESLNTIHMDVEIKFCTLEAANITLPVIVKNAVKNYLQSLQQKDARNQAVALLETEGTSALRDKLYPSIAADFNKEFNGQFKDVLANWEDVDVSAVINSYQTQSTRPQSPRFHETGGPGMYAPPTTHGASAADNTSHQPTLSTSIRGNASLA